LGCCTDVTALASAQGPGCSLFEQLSGGHLCDFVLGSSPNVNDNPDVWGCIAPRAIVGLGVTAPYRCVEGGVQEMHLLQIEHRISVEQVAQTHMEEHL
jgi:hypothetical protein